MVSLNLFTKFPVAGILHVEGVGERAGQPPAPSVGAPERNCLRFVADVTTARTAGWKERGDMARRTLDVACHTASEGATLANEVSLSLRLSRWWQHITCIISRERMSGRGGSPVLASSMWSDSGAHARKCKVNSSRKARCTKRQC